MNLNEYTFENVECQTIMLNQKREKINLNTCKHTWQRTNFYYTEAF